MITLDGRHLTLHEVEMVAEGRERDVRLAEDARQRVAQSRTYVEALLGKNERIYGVTTGFGRLSEVFISGHKILPSRLMGALWLLSLPCPHIWNGYYFAPGSQRAKDGI